MYHNYFGLNQAPFKITPDTSLFFPGGNRGAVLEALIYAITSGEGIVKVVGEVGSGKTMLCRMLEVELPGNVEVVYLANPSLSPDNILHAIAFELKLSVDEGEDRLRVMHELQEYLVKKHAENCQVVVFVEEAQSMPIATLEEIRLLSNLETKQNKLLQIVLFGQPELDQKLSRKEIRQLKERITYSFYLNPFKYNEIKEYLNARLRACGYRSTELFSTSAIREITRFSKGLLRRINILADKSMLAAYAANTHNVSRKHVTSAARDSEFISFWQKYRTVMILGSITILIFITAWLIPATRFQTVLKTSEIDNTGKIEDVQDNINQEPINDSKQIITVYLQQDFTPYYKYFSEAESLPDLFNTIEYSSEESDIRTKPSSPQLKKVEPQTSFLLGDGDLNIDDLARQLERFPPEVEQDAEDDNACNICVAIIYRPFFMNENL